MDRRGNVVATVAIVLLLARAAPAQTPSPSTIGVSEILANMAATTTGLTSYVVPVHIDARVRTGLLSLPVHMDGKRYFTAPDRSVLRMESVPAIAKQFSSMYASLGTPQTWPSTYDIVVEGPAEVSGRSVWRLRATYKRPSHVDHVLLYVDTSTYDAVEVGWFYRNGSTVVMDIDAETVDGKYRLPAREAIAAHFPDYSGNATVLYGTYETNVPVTN